MSKESYIRGFVKAANANGVDPHALAKYASDGDGIDMELAREAYKRAKDKPFFSMPFVVRRKEDAPEGDGIDMELAMEAYKRAKGKPAFSMPFVVRRKEDAPEEHEEKSLVEAIADAVRKRRGMKKKAASENGPKYRTEGYAPEGANVGKLPEFRSDGQVNEADTPRKILQSFEELRDPGVDESLMRSLDERHANYMDAAKKSYHSIYDKVIEWLKGHGNSAKYVIDRPIPANIYSLLTRNFDRSMYNYTNEPPASVQRPERLRSDGRAGSRYAGNMTGSMTR